MMVDLDIPGGPVRVRLTNVQRDDWPSTGFWRVGRRKLQVRRRRDGMWELTGNGIDLPEPMQDPDMPTAKVRAAFRRHLRQRYRAGAKVNLWDTDRNGRMGLRQRWGWSDCHEWGWGDEDAGAYETIAYHRAVPWMRAQCRAVGMTSTVED